MKEKQRGDGPSPLMALLSFLINFSGCSVFRSCPYSGGADQTALNKCLWTLLSRVPLTSRAGSSPEIVFPWLHFLSVLSFFPFGRTAARGVIIPGQRMESVLCTGSTDLSGKSPSVQFSNWMVRLGPSPHV